MNIEEAYLVGFCKMAESLGVSPAILVKAAQNYQSSLQQNNAVVNNQARQTQATVQRPAWAQQAIQAQEPTWYQKELAKTRRMGVAADRMDQMFGPQSNYFNPTYEAREAYSQNLGKRLLDRSKNVDTATYADQKNYWTGRQGDAAFNSKGNAAVLAVKTNGNALAAQRNITNGLPPTDHQVALRAEKARRLQNGAINYANMARQSAGLTTVDPTGHPAA